MGGAEREEAGGGKPWSMALTPFGEVLPYAENRVTLSAKRTDQWGAPVPVIDAAHGRNEQVMMREAARDAYDRAIGLSSDPAVRDFLMQASRRPPD